MTKHKKSKETSPEEEVPAIPTPEEKIEELTNLLQRLQAEFENYKKRVVKEKAEYKDLVKKSLIGKIIPILDHFESALMHECSDKNYAMGMGMIHNLLVDMLISEGVTVIDSIDCVFDPRKHEAISVIHDSDKKDNFVVEIKKKGYLIGDMVVRSASVIINKIKKDE